MWRMNAVLWGCCGLLFACTEGGGGSEVAATIDRIVDLERELEGEECRCDSEPSECEPEALDLRWLECFKQVAERHASELQPELECRVRKLEAEIRCLAGADCEDVAGWEACYDLEDCDDSFTESREDEVGQCARAEGAGPPGAAPGPKPGDVDAGTPSGGATLEAGVITEPDGIDSGAGDAALDDVASVDGGTRGRDGSVDAEPASASDASDTGQPVAGEVSFEVLTKVTPLARYAPRNVVAIWVEDDRGQPVRALAVWAAPRVSALEAFSALFPSLAAPESRSADVVSGATLPDHQWRRVSWDLLDHDGRRLPDGEYVMRVEVADSLDGSSQGEVPFRVGRDPLEVEVPETDELGPMRLVYTTTAP